MPLSPTSRTPPLAAQATSPASPTHADVRNKLERDREAERQAWHEQVVEAEILHRGFNDAQAIWDRERMLLVERIAGLETVGARSNSQRHRLEEEVLNLRMALKAAKRHVQSVARRLASSEGTLAAAKDDRAALEENHRKAVEVSAAREAKLNAEAMEKYDFQQEIASARGEEDIQFSSKVMDLISEHCQVVHAAVEHVRRERAKKYDRIKIMRLEYEKEFSEARDVMTMEQVADECMQKLHDAGQSTTRATDENSARPRRVRFAPPDSFKSGGQIEHLLLQALLMIAAQQCPERVMSPRRTDRINEWQTHRPDTIVPSKYQGEPVLDSMTWQPAGEPDDRTQTSRTRPSSIGRFRKILQHEHPFEKRSGTSSSKDHQHQLSSASFGKKREPSNKHHRKLEQICWQTELQHKVREKQARPHSTVHAHTLGAPDQVVEQQFAASTIDNIENPKVLQGHHAAYREWHRRKNQHFEHASVDSPPHKRYSSAQLRKSTR